MRGTGPKPLPRNPTRPIVRGKQASRSRPRPGARSAYSPAARRTLRPPTLKKSAVQGAILTVLILVVWRFVTKQHLPLYSYAYLGVIFFVAYTMLTFYWQRYLYNKQLRKQQGSPK
jgi:hypothetical protein